MELPQSCNEHLYNLSMLCCTLPKWICLCLSNVCCIIIAYVEHFSCYDKRSAVGFLWWYLCYTRSYFLLLYCLFCNKCMMKSFVSVVWYWCILQQFTIKQKNINICQTYPDDLISGNLLRSCMGGFEIFTKESLWWWNKGPFKGDYFKPCDDWDPETVILELFTFFHLCIIYLGNHTQFVSHNNIWNPLPSSHVTWSIK